MQKKKDPLIAKKKKKRVLGGEQFLCSFNCSKYIFLHIFFQNFGEFVS